MNIGEKIKQRREQLGMTQEQLADKLYTSRQTISNWENGNTIPNSVDLKELSRILKCSYEYLLSEESSKNQVNNFDDVVSSMYRGVKRHWRKIYFYFFIGSIGFFSVSLFSFIASNVFFSVAGDSCNMFDGNGIFNQCQNSVNSFSRVKIVFDIFSITTLIIGLTLLTIGIVLLVKDRKYQKANKN